MGWELKMGSQRLSTRCEKSDVQLRNIFKKQMAIGNYNGTLMYTNLYGDTDAKRRSGEGVMSVRVPKI